jgi:hypothetical protein
MKQLARRISMLTFQILGLALTALFFGPMLSNQVRVIR